MSVIIPDEFLTTIRMSESELKQEIAVMLFEKEKLTLAQASRFAGTNRIMFQHLLASRRIPIHYFPIAGAEEVQNFNWIQIRSVADRTLVEVLIDELDIGEAEFIVLALEIKAEQILIDERRDRAIAERLDLRYTGILGVLIEAKSQGLISAVKPLMNDLISRAGFWIAEPLYARVLQLAGENDEG